MPLLLLGACHGSPPPESPLPTTLASERVQKSAPVRASQAGLANLALADRCALVETILSLQGPADAPDPLSLVDRAILHAGAENLFLRVVAVLTQTDAGPRRVFEAGESCSEQWAPLASDRQVDANAQKHLVARLALSPADSGYAFHAQLEVREGEPLKGARGEPISGRVIRNTRGNWQPAPGTLGAPTPRRIDTAPRSGRLQRALEHGRAETWFEFDTGGDQMGGPNEIGLTAVVRYEDRELRQTVASCNDPSKGSALGDLDETQLDLALCDHPFLLISQPGAVLVQRVEDDGTPSDVARFWLPTAVTRASNPNANAARMQR